MPGGDPAQAPVPIGRHLPAGGATAHQPRTTRLRSATCVSSLGKPCAQPATSGLIALRGDCLLDEHPDRPQPRFN
jgi:hypothetical protein